MRCSGCVRGGDDVVTGPRAVDRVSWAVNKVFQRLWSFAYRKRVRVHVYVWLYRWVDNDDVFVLLTSSLDLFCVYLSFRPFCSCCSHSLCLLLGPGKSSDVGTRYCIRKGGDFETRRHDTSLFCYLVLFRCWNSSKACCCFRKKKQTQKNVVVVIGRHYLITFKV